MNPNKTVHSCLSNHLTGHRVQTLRTESLTWFFWILMLALGPVFSSSGNLVAQDWTGVAGAAKDVGVGADGTVWIIGANANPSGYDIYKWTDTAWKQMPGAAARIAVDPSGNAWVVNAQGNIFRWTGTNWQGIPGLAKDIGVGADGTVWIIGANQIDASGYDIYKWTGTAWRQVPGAAARIAVDPTGNAWVVNTQGAIYRWRNNGWQGVAGLASDVGSGADGSVWIIGSNQNPHGFDIYRRTGTTWTQVPGAASQVSVGPTGEAWVVNAQGNIFRWTGTTGTPQPGKLADEFLNAHNQQRAKKNVAPLTWSAELANTAQEWVEKLAAEKCGNIDHRPDSYLHPRDLGENLATASSSPNPPTKGPTQVVDDWVSEEKDYNYANNTCSAGAVCGHYTQVVWAKTKEVGCGEVSCEADEWKTKVWACNYRPAQRSGERPY